MPYWPAAVSRKSAAAIALALFAALGPWRCLGRLGSGVVALNAKNFDLFVHNSPRVIIDFFANDPEQAEMEKALRQVRDFGHSAPFAKLDANLFPDIAKKYVPTGKYPQLVWFQHGEVTKYHRTLRQSKDISTFVMALDRDPIVAVNREEDANDFSRSVLVRAKKASSLYKKMEVVASKHMDTVAFCSLESSDETVQWLANEAVVDTFTGEVTVDDIERWVRQRLTVSDDVPEEPIAEDGSTIVVGKTFEEIVLQADKDVFLMVYAPWCGFSRKAFPVFAAFAREMADVPHLVVAKIDGDRNKSPLDDFLWTAYPTFFFVRAGEKAPIVFEGNRTLEGFVEFTKEHSTQAITINTASVTMEPGIEIEL